MELVSLAKEMFQSVAEQVASYRLGQTLLKWLDRGLWIVEKSARWAVPPPLDQDERPQPELVRPLPWVFFLALLITLRVTRESISLINLVMGKPPLRSADVVMYIQSKRRYLRTLKYQGNRIMRARTSSGQPQQSWYSRVQALLDFTMCFRNSHNYGNNNTTCVSNNDEMLVVKRRKHGRQPTTAAGVASSAAAAESTMDRLIEKMMQDLDADSDDDSSFTLTNVRSDRSDSPESDQDTVLHRDASTPTKSNTSETDSSGASNEPEQPTPQNNESPKRENDVTEKEGDAGTADEQHETRDEPEKQMNTESTEKQENEGSSNEQVISEETESEHHEAVAVTQEDAALQMATMSPRRSVIEDTQMWLQHERSPYLQQHSPNSDHKNGKKCEWTSSESSQQ